MINLYLFRNDYFGNKIVVKSPSCQERIDAYKDEETHLSSSSAYYFLQKEGLAIYFSELGKPLARNKNTFVSISHSSNYVLVAIGDEDVGVDLQKENEYNIKLNDKVFSKDEKENYQQNNNQLKFFYEIFTSKEAYTKRLGTGLTSFPCDITLKGNIDVMEVILKDGNFVIAVSTESFTDIKFHKLELCQNEKNDNIQKKINKSSISISDNEMLREHGENSDKRYSTRTEKISLSKNKTTNIYKKRYYSDFED